MENHSSYARKPQAMQKIHHIAILLDIYDFFENEKKNLNKINIKTKLYQIQELVLEKTET